LAHVAWQITGVPERQAERSPDVLAEAKAIQQKIVDELRKQSYAELQRFSETEMREVTASSGKLYRVEIFSFWDEKPKGNLRVTVSIFPAGPRSPKIPISSFIVAPDGHFVGE
jgi:hypothetical protein